MMNKSTLRFGLLIGLLLTGCGERPDDGAAAADTINTGIPGPADATAVAESSRVQSERAVAEMTALDSADAREYRLRLASMGSYKDCVTQARDLPPETRKIVEASCARR